MPSAHTFLGLSAVILCGEGESLKHLVSTTKLPKALLPIANKPMLQYPLEWVYDAGLTSIIIVCHTGQEADITTFLQQHHKSYKPSSKGPKPPLPTVIPASSPSALFGTAEVLRLPQVYNAIKTDFLLLSCDSICEIPCSTIIKQWLSLPDSPGHQRPGMGVFYELKKEKGLERDLILTVPTSRYSPKAPHLTPEDPALGTGKYEISNLVYNYGSRTEESKSEITVKTSLFKRHPRADMHTSWRDAHLYIMPYWSLQFILQNPHGKLSSVKNDVLGWWAKACWQGSGLLAHKMGLFDILDPQKKSGERKSGEGGESVSGGSSQIGDGAGGVGGELKPLGPEDLGKFLGMSSMRSSVWNCGDKARKGRKEINTRGWFPAATSNEAIQSATAGNPTLAITEDEDEEMSSGRSTPVINGRKFKKIKTPQYNGMFIPPFVVFKPEMNITPLSTTPLVRRVDTFHLYLSTCLELARNPLFNTQPVSATATVHTRANVSLLDSMVGDGATLDEKVLVKRSVVGKGVTVESMARIQGCVLLEGVVVGKGCKLEGCVIGRFVKLGAGVNLSSCQVAEGVVLRESTEVKDTVITESNDQDEESDSEDDIFGPSEGGQDDVFDSNDDDDDDDDDSEDDSSDDRNTTTKSVPTTTRESVAPISAAPAAVVPTPPAPSVVEETKTVSEVVPVATPPGSAVVEETTKETQTVVAGKDDEEEEEAEDEEETGPVARFLEVEYEEEEEEEADDGDFEFASDDSSYCDEEYDSQYESEEDAVETVDDEDPGNLSGPEEDGGPLKSPKRISRGFGDDMARSLAQMTGGLSLGEVAEGADKVEESEKEVKKEELPGATEVKDVEKDVKVNPA